MTHAIGRASAEFQDIRLTIPARPERRGLTVGLRSSKTFVPGPSDPRPLGVMLDRLSLTPEGVVLALAPHVSGLPDGNHLHRVSQLVECTRIR